MLWGILWGITIILRYHPLCREVPTVIPHGTNSYIMRYLQLYREVPTVISWGEKKIKMLNCQDWKHAHRVVNIFETRTRDGYSLSWVEQKTTPGVHKWAAECIVWTIIGHIRGFLCVKRLREPAISEINHTLLCGQPAPTVGVIVLYSPRRSNKPFLLT